MNKQSDEDKLYQKELETEIDEEIRDEHDAYELSKKSGWFYSDIDEADQNNNIITTDDLRNEKTNSESV